MPVDYVDFEDAPAMDGLHMVVVSGVPSPWGEAAKGILHGKEIPWKAVRLGAADDDLASWTGERSGLVAMYEGEGPRSGWAPILFLAERLAPNPALLPADPAARAQLLGLAHEICGEEGLGWARRLQGVHAGLNGEVGFPAWVVKHLAGKYGYVSDQGARYQRRVIDLLSMLSGVLRAQSGSGRRFYVGDTLSAVDLYGATFMALFKQLPQA